MAAEHHVIGLFTDESRAAAAAARLRESAWQLQKVFSPVPSRKLTDALKSEKSPVGYFTLCGGIVGFVCGLALAMFTATRWSLIVSGKPIVALIPFFIVGFESTILFAVMGNVIGMLVLTGLPRYDNLRYYDPRCSGSHFGILASCRKDGLEGLTGFFKEQGAEVKVLD
jgi:molybdopterin-containing oxidoreductase family membrane subunit